MKKNIIFLFFVLSYAYPILNSQDDATDFEMIEHNQIPDMIFDIIERGNTQELNTYLQKNPYAINARTPYMVKMRTVCNYQGFQKVTFIQHGDLPIHAALAKKDISCLQVLLRNAQAYQNDIKKYHAGILQELNLNENNSRHIECKSFLESALTSHIANNDILNSLLAISSQKEKNQCLQKSLHHMYRDQCSKDFKKYEYWTNRLLQAGADINYKNECGETSLHQAATHDYACPHMTQDLIKNYGADIKLRYGEEENSLIHETVKQGSWTELKNMTLQILLDNGLLINTPNKHGQTPAHVAFESGSVYAGYVLATRCRASLICKDNYGKTPFDYYQSNTRPKNIGDLYDCTDLVNEDFDNKKISKQDTNLGYAITQIYQKQLTAKTIK